MPAIVQALPQPVQSHAHYVWYADMQVGRTPFHDGAFFGRKNVVRVMLNNGMEQEAKDKVRLCNNVDKHLQLLTEMQLEMQIQLEMQLFVVLKLIIKGRNIFFILTEWQYSTSLCLF